MARRRRSSKPKYEIRPHAFKAGDLQDIVRRLDRIDADTAALGEDRKQLLVEAKAKGFHPTMITKVMGERKLDSTKRTNVYEVLDSYRSALGMLEGTPLGDAAAAKEANGSKAPVQVVKINSRAKGKTPAAVEAHA